MKYFLLIPLLASQTYFSQSVSAQLDKSSKETLSINLRVTIPDELEENPTPREA